MLKLKIEKFISLCGICSRREAGNLIHQRRVKVENKILTNIAERVDIDSRIYLDQNLIQPITRVKVWKYYKPLGVICTKKDPLKRVTIFDEFLKHNITSEKFHLISVGRLDINSEGLILLTNYGEFARQMELPQNGIKRIYKIRAFGNLTKFFHINKSDIQKKLGYKISKIELITPKNNISQNNWFKIILTEGKNREVRNIFDFLDLQVNKLIRIRYGDFDLGNMKPGNLILTRTEKLNYQKFEQAANKNHKITNIRLY